MKDGYALSPCSEISSPTCSSLTLTRNGVNTLTIATQISVRGMQVDMQMQPKIKFEIVVSSEEWEVKTIEAIEKAAYTGEPGDGKIFTYEIRHAQKIRTKETGYDAIQATE